MNIRVACWTLLVVVLSSESVNASPLPSACIPTTDSHDCDVAILSQFMNENGLVASDVYVEYWYYNNRLVTLYVYKDIQTFSNLGLLTWVGQLMFKKCMGTDPLPLGLRLWSLIIEGVPNIDGGLGPIPAEMKTLMIWGSSPNPINLTGPVPSLPQSMEKFVIGPQTHLTGPLPGRLRDPGMKQFILSSDQPLGLLPTPLAPTLTHLVVGPTNGPITGSLPPFLNTLYLWGGLTGSFPVIPNTVMQGSLAGNLLTGTPSHWKASVTWFPQQYSTPPSIGNLSLLSPGFYGEVSDDLGVVSVSILVNGQMVPTFVRGNRHQGWYAFYTEIPVFVGDEVRVIAIDSSGISATTMMSVSSENLAKRTIEQKGGTSGWILNPPVFGPGEQEPCDNTEPDPGKRGDANGDGTISIGDIFMLVNHLFASGPPPSSLCLGDANHDDAVTIGDVIFLINHLFASGPLPMPCWS